MQPASIGPFQVVRELGRGGMGVVYLAVDTRLDRQVAIKALPADLAADPDRMARFQREAKVLASLNHPNVGGIHGLEQVGNDQYLILEFIEGETLSSRLEQGPLPTNEALSLAKQMAEGLEAAHDKGITHRDFKPGNVMVTVEGAVKVVDFGLARTADGSPSSATYAAMADSPTLTTPVRNSPTIPGVIMGTAGYMSPEQARGRPVDKRSDIFSFGCVLFEMMTGAGPFPGETVTDSLGAILHREPDWTALPSSTPPRIRELLAKCLAKDRKNRLHDIGDARLELDRTIAGHEWMAAGEDAARTPRHSLLTTLGAFAVGAVAVALGVVGWHALAPTNRLAMAEQMCVAITMPPDVVVRSADLSPDGKFITLLGRPRGSSSSDILQSRIYYRAIDDYQFKQVAGSEGALVAQPALHSRSVLFCGLAKMGGTKLRFARAPLVDPAPPTILMDWSALSFWGGFVEMPNGDYLIGTDSLSFIRLPKAGGPAAAAIKLEAGRPGVVRVDLCGEVLPGGQHALADVIAYGDRGWQYSVGVVELSSGHVKTIVDDGGRGVLAHTGHLVFSRGSTLYAAPFDTQRMELRSAPVAVLGGVSSPLASLPGEFRLTTTGTLFYSQVPAEGWGTAISIMGADGKLEPWANEGAILREIVPSPDASRVLLQLVNARGIDELRISPLNHADLIKVNTESNADLISGVWSPDGTQIAYCRIAKDDGDGIYVQNADGGAPRRVFKPQSPNHRVLPQAWLANGNKLVLEVSEGGRARIMFLPVGETTAEASALNPILTSGANCWDAKTSPDGRLISFTSDESGKFQTWVAELRAEGEAGRPLQVRTMGSALHAWGQDGKTLYVVDERGRLMKATVNTEPQFSVSAPTEVADVDSMGIRVLASLPEGRLMVGVPSQSEDIKQFNMIVNWAESLMKKAPNP